MKLPWQPLLEAELCEAELQQWEEALGKPKAWVTRRGLVLSRDSRASGSLESSDSTESSCTDQDGMPIFENVFRIAAIFEQRRHPKASLKQP